MRKSVVGLVVAVALTLAGCTGIPYSGSVRKGVPAVDVENSDIQFLPAGPALDSTPEQILRGFVEAGTNPSGDWSTAREYLSPDFAQVWTPSDGVTVDGGNRTIMPGSGGALTMTTEVAASVDDVGNYSSTTRALSRTYGFAVVQVQGQWRISKAPSGVIIDSSAFPRVFAATPLFFYSPDFERFIPDVRWFPKRASTSTQVVQAILDGPSSWLAASGAVASAIPPGTALVADSVPVESGQASVNLDSKSFKADSRGTALMLDQISASLSGVDEVSSVRLAYSGILQAEKTVPEANILVTNKGTTQPLVVQNGNLGFLAGTNLAAIAGLSQQSRALTPVSVSLSHDRSLAAITTDTGVFAVRTDGTTTKVDSRDGLIANVDANDFVWTVPEAAPASIRVTGRTGSSREIVAPWSDAQRVRFLTLSEDGSRLLAGVVTPRGNEFCAASIGYGDDSWPRVLGPCLSTQAPAGRLMSASWIDASRVAVISAAGAPSLRVLTIGGTFADAVPPIGAMVVSGAGALRTPRVLTNYGELYELSDAARWVVVGSKISVLGFTQ